MKIHEYNEMMRYLTRKPETLSKVEKKEIVKDFYKKAEQPKAKPMPILKYISKMNSLYGNSKTDEYGNEETATTRIQELDKKPKKKIIKKTLIVEKPRPKPTYLNGNVIDITPMIDDEWWNIFEEKPPEDKVLLKVPKRKLRGLAALLNVG